MAQLNQKAMEAGLSCDIHAATDITGNGLAGHAWEMARASGVQLRFTMGTIPLLPGARKACQDGFVPGGARSNGRYLGDALELDGVGEVDQNLLLDPQTSGGLLFAVSPNDAKGLCTRLEDNGVLAASVGWVAEGPASVRLST